jgi:quercetin dioxygenase-like cupin family protein
MPETKKTAAAKLRALDGQVHQFDVPGEMTGLLQRVRGNKSKRTAGRLLETGPVRIQVIAFDEGGELKDNGVDGPYTVQCLIGRVVISVQGREHRLSTGDLLVVDARVAHDIAAQELSALLITVAAGDGSSR